MTTPQNVLVTGANRGLGLAFAGHYLAAGHHVLATARDLDAATDLNDLAARYPETATLARLDVAEGHSIEALLGSIPFERVDLLINNAGVFGAPEEAVPDLNFDVMAETFAVNAMGPLRLIKGLWGRLAAGARLVNVTSRMGSIGDNSSGGRYSYRMSKAALNMAIRNVAHDLEPRGMIAVVIHPGWVQTDMGGTSAPMTVQESVTSMTRTIDGLKPEHNGQFLNHDGSELPW